jgi:hypothetical protein
VFKFLYTAYLKIPSLGRFRLYSSHLQVPVHSISQDSFARALPVVLFSSELGHTGDESKEIAQRCCGMVKQRGDILHHPQVQLHQEISGAQQFLSGGIAFVSKGGQLRPGVVNNTYVRFI